MSKIELDPKGLEAARLAVRDCDARSYPTFTEVAEAAIRAYLAATQPDPSAVKELRLAPNTWPTSSSVLATLDGHKLTAAEAERDKWRHAAEKGAALCRAVTNDLMDDSEWCDAARSLYDEVIELAVRTKLEGR